MSSASIQTSAIFPASFDPFTPAHRELITQAAAIFDHVYVMVANNSAKNHMFAANDRLRMVTRACQQNEFKEKITVFQSSDLVVNETRARNINHIIRGLRNQGDWEYEQRIQHMNTILRGDLVPVYLTTSPRKQPQSSSMYRELTALVPNIQPGKWANWEVDEATLFLCVLNSEDGISKLYKLITGQQTIPPYLASHLGTHALYLDKLMEQNRYHTCHHTHRVLQTMLEYRETNIFSLLAAMYHDIVYSAAPGYDHEQEACNAFKTDNENWANPKFIAKVQNSILLTKHQNIPEYKTDMLLLDADLEYLSDEPNAYAHSLEQIKREFMPHITSSLTDPNPERTWILGRARWAKKFLEKFPEVYHTELFRTHHSQQAIANLQSDIARAESLTT